jgi:hypothetical protein
MMAQLVVLVAGLLLIAESQASDVADRSTAQGFLSKSSMSDYDKFITPNLNRVKTATQAQEFDLLKTVDREEKQAVQKLLAQDSSNPISLYAIGVGLLSLVTMLGFRLRRGLQSDMPMNTASALGDNLMEMKSQDSNVNSSRVGWGQLSSQNTQPLTLCYAAEPAPQSASLLTGSPFGYFDPLQLSKGKTQAEMNQLREYELKHGRVAMAAVFGLIVEPWIHPLAKSCHLEHPTDPILSGVELNFAGKAQILAFCAGVEFLNYKIKDGDKYKPGDLLGANYYVADEEDEFWVSYQEKELNNGRLAMVAFAGFVTQYLLYGNVDDMLFKPLVKPASELTCYGWICS